MINDASATLFRSGILSLQRARPSARALSVVVRDYAHTLSSPLWTPAVHRESCRPSTLYWQDVDVRAMAELPAVRSFEKMSRATSNHLVARQQDVHASPAMLLLAS